MKLPAPLYDAVSYLYATQADLTAAAMSAPLSHRMSLDKNMTAYIQNKMVTCGQHFFNTMGHIDQAFVLAHEWMHYILQHRYLLKRWIDDEQVTGRRHKGAPEVTYPFDMKTAQKALDLVVNDALLHMGFKEVPKPGSHEPRIGSMKDLECDVYIRLYEYEPPKQDEPENGQGPGWVLAAGVGEDPDPADQAIIREFVDAMTEKLTAMGKSPGSFRCMMDKVLAPKINWLRYIQPRYAAVCGTGRAVWVPPDRQMFALGLYQQSQQGRCSGTVVVIVDTSGSVGRNERSAFLAGLVSMTLTVMPKRLIVLEIDASVRRSSEFTKYKDVVKWADEVRERDGFRGGGGTNMRKGYEWIQEQATLVPDLTIYLTDGGTPFPDDLGRSKRVVWVSTTTVEAPAHAGETVRIVV